MECIIVQQLTMIYDIVWRELTHDFLRCQTGKVNIINCKQNSSFPSNSQEKIIRLTYIRSKPSAIDIKELIQNC